MKSPLNLLFIRIALTISLVGGLLIRLKDINLPLADWHSWRQTDTVSVAREYVKHGIDLLRPTYQDLSSLPSGKENPQGYRMVEFPIVNGFVAWIYKTIPGMNRYELHVVYRFINILFSLISAIMLYILISRLESPFTGLLAAVAFLFIPYNIYYSRTTLPEVAMVSMSLIALTAGTRYIESVKLIPGIIFVGFAALALLTKPTAVFLLLPLIPYAVSKQGIKAFVSMKNILPAILIIVPFLLWRRWILQYPEGIPASSWLLNGNGIRFKGAFFQWIFADRIGRLILGYWGLVIMTVGLLARKKSHLIRWLLIGSLLYVTIFATGNVQHDYYQIPLIPIISVLLAYGIQYLRRLSADPVSKYGVIVISSLFMFAFSWYQVRGYFNINNPAIVAAGKAIDAIAPADAKIIAPYGGDTAFLYQTNRQGWPLGGNIENKIAAGARYYVSISFDDETQAVANQYHIVQQTPAFTIIDLLSPSVR